MDQRKSAITHRASGRVRVSWDSARVSARVRVKNPKDKRLFFIGLDWVVLLSVCEFPEQDVGNNDD